MEATYLVVNTPLDSDVFESCYEHNKDFVPYY